MTGPVREERPFGHYVLDDREDAVSRLLPRVQYDEHVPAEVRAAFQPHFDRWAVYLPTWCHELLVRWDGGNTGADLECHVSMEYRWAKIIICPSWLHRTEAERNEAVLHEILHVQLEPLQNAQNDFLDHLKAKHPDLHEWASEQARYAKESTCTDLTRAIVRAHQAAGRG